MYKIKKLNFDNGKESFIYLSKDSTFVSNLSLMGGGRVEIKSINNPNNKVAGELVIVNDSNILDKNEIGLSNISFKRYKGPENDDIEVSKISNVPSFNGVIDKLRGIPFKRDNLHQIMKDIVDGYYSPAHVASFCSACEGDNLNIEEIAYMTEAMANAGDRLKWPYDIVVDKHCLGGIPANRTTNVVIPIVAAYGLHIPKMSSRSITSPSGTADTMEVLTNVDFSAEELQDLVNKVNGCIIWNGHISLSPADSLIVNTKKNIGVDSEGQVIAAILSIKIAAGSTDILIVLPTGPTAKIKNMEQFNRIKNIYESVGKQLGVNVVAEYEDGSQPIGNGIGPALEAMDILKLFKNEPDAPHDLKEVSLHLAGKIIEFDKKNVKEGEGYNIAKEILESGKAYKKFMEIIEAQGGLKQIPSAKFTKDILADKDGNVVSMDNKKISQTCRILGCPEYKASGLYLHKHIKDVVKKGDILFTLHSETKGSLEDAIKYVNDNELMDIK